MQTCAMETRKDHDAGFTFIIGAARHGHTPPPCFTIPGREVPRGEAERRVVPHPAPPHSAS